MGDEHQNSCSVVEGRAVSFRFGESFILNELDITVKRGVIYGLLGPSGCGKTTLLKCIVGRLKPKSGTIRVFGKIPGQKGFCVPGPGVGFMPQELALYPEITTEEILTYFGRVYQMSDKDIKERISFLTDFLDIPSEKKQIKNLSGGQQRRVSFAAAIIHKPPLVILDEPTVGVDPLLRKNMWNYLQSLATVDLLTIIITTHYVEEARQAHIVGLMRDGRLLAESNPEYLMTKYSAITLEDVFLSLCAKDKAGTETHCDANLYGEERPSNHSKEESHEDVWLKRKTERDCNSVPVANNHFEYTASLLNHSAEPDKILKSENNWNDSIKASAVRMNALYYKSFVRLKRNLPLVFFQVLVPAFQAIVFCVCIGGEPYNLPLAVLNLETDPDGIGNIFLQQINSKSIRQIHYSNFTTAFESVKHGQNWGVLYIKSNFTECLVNRYLDGLNVDNETVIGSTISLYLDMTNHQITMTIHTKLMEAFQDFSKKMLKDSNQNPLLAQSPLVLEKPIYGHENPNFTNFLAPGMVLALTYMMAIPLSSLSIVIEKKEGLLDRSWIAGVKSWEVIFSILSSLFVVMLFQMALVLLFTFLTFSITCLGPLIWVIIAVILAGMEGMAYGLFISSITNNENVATMITMGSFFPNMLLSSIIWPIEAMPYYVQPISYGLPLTLICNAARSIISRGWSITDNGVWKGYLVAIAWIIPPIILSTFFFKHRH